MSAGAAVSSRDRLLHIMHLHAMHPHLALFLTILNFTRLEENDIVTRCELTTFEAGEVFDLPYDDAERMQKLILQVREARHDRFFRPSCHPLTRCVGNSRTVLSVTSLPGSRKLSPRSIQAVNVSHYGSVRQTLAMARVETMMRKEMREMKRPRSSTVQRQRERHPLVYDTPRHGQPSCLKESRTAVRYR